MNKSAQLRDLTHQWPERRKSCAADTLKSCASAPVRRTVNPMIACRSIASSSTSGTVTRVATSASSLKKHRYGSRHRRLPPICVKLAEENVPSEQSDSDSSCYDSFNEMETDSAKDESDCSAGYESCGDRLATVDVFEYEVDDSSDSEDLYSHGSSSGTDDMVEALVARAIFASSSSSSSGDSDAFEIFAQDANTEESDVPTDPELGCADYWTCIKCKNQKNNPMYRYCEKCYQIRKNHFPPRPRHRRKRSSLARQSSSKLLGLSSPSTSSTISTQDEKPDEDGRISRTSSDGSDVIGNQSVQARKQIQRRRTTSHKQTHSAGESSCCSSQGLSHDEHQSTLPASYLMAGSSQETYCSEIEEFVNLNSKQSNLSLFEYNYPNSQESEYPNSEVTSQASVYQNGCSLSKLDSSASTVSGCSGFSQSSSSSQFDSNGNQTNAAATINSNISSSDGVMEPTSTTSINGSTYSAKKKKKRKIDFSDEVSDNDIDDDELMAKKFRAMDDADSSNGMCMICLSEPKNGAFVHNRFLHVCCCYRCTVKVWNKRKRCPICNSQVKTVLKMSVH